MSTLNVDKVDPSTGTALEIGSSGDTITIPSGATIVNSGTATGFGAVLTGSTNNQVTTVTAANAIQGETNLTYDGTILGCGATGASADLGVGIHIRTADTGATANASSDELVIEGTGGAGMAFLSPTDGSGQITFSDSGGNEQGRIIYVHDGDYMSLRTDNSERMRIDSSGNLIISKTSTSDTVAGNSITPNGGIWSILNASGYSIVNRQDDDGVFIYFKQANSTEGNISVSGTSVSYNGFTGTHWTRLADNSKPTILRGTVLETLDEMVDWYNLEFDVITQDDDGNDVTTPQKIPHLLTDSQSAGDVITYNHEGTDYQATIVKEADIKHMKSKISDTIDAKNVYGVFNHWDFGDDDGINDIIVASVGSFVVRIKSGETVAKGDLLQSNGDGTAKVQSDDNVKSSSFAKVLSTTIIETYEDGSYLVPCSLKC